MLSWFILILDIFVLYEIKIKNLAIKKIFYESVFNKEDKYKLFPFMRLY